MTKNEDRPEKIRTTIEELEVLTRLKGSIEWAILKRVMRRYITHLRHIAYNLPYALSGEDFKVRHREMTAQALGFKRLVRLVEKAEDKMERKEK